MPEIKVGIIARGSISVRPGPVTVAQQAALGRHWCECHKWHDRSALTCPAERRPAEA